MDDAIYEYALMPDRDQLPDRYRSTDLPIHRHIATHNYVVSP